MVILHSLAGEQDRRKIVSSIVLVTGRNNRDTEKQ
jgi:hypothetical protein